MLITNLLLRNSRITFHQWTSDDLLLLGLHNWHWLLLHHLLLHHIVWLASTKVRKDLIIVELLIHAAHAIHAHGLVA